ncbi:hypothetical protein [Candidatus Magnetaquicoccus inordinatus]|uniref:hypothetical protein n=1 Tax=Candidatus Magnetaquicoccus inordinatus TaxID=2496818 RepID=UPI00187D636C|nr:hypothetical protein [Candidatus Magnetaquicoccus inordinatus]
MLHTINKQYLAYVLLAFCVMLSACTSREMGEAAYRSLEQVSCYDQHHSHGRCIPPVQE